MLQFKRLSYSLREDRRKILNEYDLDAYTLSKVGLLQKSGTLLKILIIIFSFNEESF